MPKPRVFYLTWIWFENYHSNYGEYQKVNFLPFEIHNCETNHGLEKTWLSNIDMHFYSSSLSSITKTSVWHFKPWAQTWASHSCFFPDFFKLQAPKICFNSSTLQDLMSSIPVRFQFLFEHSQFTVCENSIGWKRFGSFISLHLAYWRKSVCFRPFHEAKHFFFKKKTLKINAPNSFFENESNLLYMNVVILRCNNCEDIYIKHICGTSTCCMTMIRRALDSPMSKDLPRYLQRCRRHHRKFSSVVWTKSSSSKHEVLSEYSSLTLSFIFQNLNFFHFSWRIIRLVRRMVTIFLLTQRTRSSGPLRYLQRCRTPHRKFSTVVWKKNFQLKKWIFKLCQHEFSFWQNVMFWAGTFCSNDGRKFSMRSTTTFKVPEGSAWPCSLRQ